MVDRYLHEARQAIASGRYDVAMLIIGRAAQKLTRGDDAARRQLAELADVAVERAFRRVVH